MKEQDISSDIEQQPPFVIRNEANHCLKWGVGGGWDVLQNQGEHHIILTYEAVLPTVVSENYSLLGMQTILIKSKHFK